MRAGAVVADIVLALPIVRVVLAGLTLHRVVWRVRTLSLRALIKGADRAVGGTRPRDRLVVAGVGLFVDRMTHVVRAGVLILAGPKPSALTVDTRLDRPAKKVGYGLCTVCGH